MRFGFVRGNWCASYGDSQSNNLFCLFFAVVSLGLKFSKEEQSAISHREEDKYWEFLGNKPSYQFECFAGIIYCCNMSVVVFEILSIGVQL